jgi:hypothetical protein
MNLRHAAAIALVGWYLIFPPTKADVDPHCFLPSLSGAQQKLCDSEGLQMALDAPLSKWKAGSVWQDLAECEADRKRPDDPEAVSLLNRTWETLSNGTGISRDAYAAAYRRSNDGSKCIDTADPRAEGIRGPGTIANPGLKEK